MQQSAKLLSSDVVCQAFFTFLFAFSDIYSCFPFSSRFTFLQLVFLPFVESCLFRYLLLTLVGRGRVHLCKSFGNISASTPFPVSDFTRDYGAYINSWSFAVIHMNEDSAYVWDVRFQCDRDPAVGAWQKRWWHWSGRDASVCGCIKLDVTLLSYNVSKK